MPLPPPLSLTPPIHFLDPILFPLFLLLIYSTLDAPRLDFVLTLCATFAIFVAGMWAFWLAYKIVILGLEFVVEVLVFGVVGVGRGKGEGEKEGGKDGGVREEVRGGKKGEAARKSEVDEVLRGRERSGREERRQREGLTRGEKTQEGVGRVDKAPRLREGFAKGRSWYQ